MPWAVAISAFLTAGHRTKALTKEELDALRAKQNLELEAITRKWRDYWKRDRVRRRWERMQTRLERRRAAIRAKWKARAVGLLIILVAAPLVAIAVSFAWRAAVWAIAS